MGGRLFGLSLVLMGLGCLGAGPGGAQPAGDSATQDQDVVLLDPGPDGTGGREIVLPVQSPAPATGQEPVIVLALLSPDQVRALPLRPGRPEPSVLIGLIEGITDSGLALSWDDLDGRRALRANNPDLFDSLLVAGALDPPEALLAVALQSELERMECYALVVDGDWGNGSRRSAQRYLAELEGVAAPFQQPNTDLFRVMLRNDAVTCPAVQPAAQVPATPQQQAPAPVQNTAPPADNPFGAGSGVFR